jgi:phenylacetate-CoA oxygenase PaaJ subunit
MVSARETAGSVPDPEFPVLTIADLGILRDVREADGAVTVTITPTYSGCPAMAQIAADLRRRLERAGFREVAIRTELSPPWTTDWITPDGRRKLAEASHRRAPVAGLFSCRSRCRARAAGRLTPASSPGSAAPRARRSTSARPARSRSST